MFEHTCARGVVRVPEGFLHVVIETSDGLIDACSCLSDHVESSSRLCHIQTAAPDMFLQFFHFMGCLLAFDQSP